MIARFLWLLLLGFVAAVPASAATYTAIANRDARIREDSSGSNFGSEAELQVRPVSGDNRRSVIGFTIPAIPSGEIVTSATLRLYVTSRDNSGTVRVHQVTESWTEGSVTWNNTSEDYAPTAESSASMGSSGTFVTFDITALARGWRDGTIVNNGAMVISNGSADGRFGSSENGTSSRRPLLTINTVVAPVLTVLKSASVFSDPLNGTTNPKAIPGAAMTYTISVSNSANGTTTSGTTQIVDAVPTNMELYVGDLGGAGSGPVSFTNGTPSSGLTYTYGGIGNTGDSLSFSTDGTNYNYVPNPAVNGGYDASITHIMVNPAGSFAAKTGASNPNFTMQMRMRVK
jgi:uncharacterized repeat protein (TIGR01451 family)